jgi:hypothetical protein
VRNYDPGIPADSALPAPADLVVCTDVLEHIEPEHLDAVLAHIFRLAQRAVFLQIALFPAKKTLPDGRNAHLIVQPANWWLDKIGKHVGRGVWRLAADAGTKHLQIKGARRKPV